MISIIIPVFKAESTIRRCVESVLKQSYIDYELLLVDDGSPDSSGQICDEYANMDSRVKVLHQSNGGVSAARNNGLKHAGGDYITFIDSDDWIESNYLQTLVELAEREHSDLVVCGIYRNFPLKQETYDIVDSVFTIQTENARMFHRLIQSRLVFGPCNKLFKSDIITRHNVIFPAHIDYGEDRLFNYEYLRYHYVMGNEESLSSKNRNNLFELELSQWRELRDVYITKGVLNDKAFEDLLTELYWMISDNALKNATSYSLAGLKRIRHILSTSEIIELRQLASNLQQNLFLKYSLLYRQALLLWLTVGVLSSLKRK